MFDFAKSSVFFKIWMHSWMKREKITYTNTQSSHIFSFFSLRFYISCSFREYAFRMSLSVKKRDCGQKVSKLTPTKFGFRGIVENSNTGKFCFESDKTCHQRFSTTFFIYIVSCPENDSEGIGDFRFSLQRIFGCLYYFFPAYFKKLYNT